MALVRPRVCTLPGVGLTWVSSGAPSCDEGLSPGSATLALVSQMGNPRNLRPPPPPAPGTVVKARCVSTFCDFADIYVGLGHRQWAGQREAGLCGWGCQPPRAAEQAGCTEVTPEPGFEGGVGFSWVLRADGAHQGILDGTCPPGGRGPRGAGVWSPRGRRSGWRQRLVCALGWSCGRGDVGLALDRLSGQGKRGHQPCLVRRCRPLGRGHSQVCDRVEWTDGRKDRWAGVLSLSEEDLGGRSRQARGARGPAMLDWGCGVDTVLARGGGRAQPRRSGLAGCGRGAEEQCRGSGSFALPGPG